jgi:hypothetical protein
MKTRSGFAIVSLLGIASLVQAPAVFAQEPTSASTDNNGGWRRLGDQTAQDAANQAEVRDDAKEIEDLSDLAPSGPELAQRRGPAGPPPPNARGPQGQRNQPPVPAPRPLPAQLNVAAGTFFTIRVNQAISTDHSQVGDAFTAQLVKPIVVDGRIIADRGQTIAGRVAEVQKGGRIRGTSRLGVELTEMTLVDGQQIPVRSQLATPGLDQWAGMPLRLERRQVSVLWSEPPQRADRLRQSVLARARRRA